MDTAKGSTFSERPAKLNLERSSIDRSPNAIANTVMQSNQETPLAQRKVKSTKRKGAIPRLTIRINQSVTEKDQRWIDENANHAVFESGSQSFVTPKKRKLSPALFGQRSLQLSPFSSKAFSPSNVNKSNDLSVAEIIENWPFKQPQKRTISDADNGSRPVENVVHTVKCLEASIPDNNNNNEVEKRSSAANALSDERYPKSLYVSPIITVGRRLTRRNRNDV